MIEPAKKDVGRRVFYTGNGGRNPPPKEGVVTGFDLHCVYVRYDGHTTSKGDRRQDLQWAKDPN